MGRRFREFVSAILAVVFFLLATGSSAHALVYFVDEGDQFDRLGRISYESGKLETSFPTNFDPSPAKLNPSLFDSDSEHLYFVVKGSSGPSLLRVAVDGTGARVLYKLLPYSVTDLEVSGGMAYVKYERDAGNGSYVWANRLATDGSGVDESWVPALNGVESCPSGIVGCLVTDLAVDESSGSAYWIVQIITGFLEFEYRMMRAAPGDGAITKLFETRLSAGDPGEILDDPVAGDGHLYWTTEIYGGDAESIKYVGHASTSDHVPDYDFAAYTSPGIGVVGGKLYRDGSIVNPSGQVTQAPSLPEGSAGAAVDALTDFPVNRACLLAQEERIGAQAALGELKLKLTKAKQKVNSAQRKWSKAKGKAKKKAASTLRKAKATVKTTTEKLSSQRGRIGELQDVEWSRCIP